MLERETNIWKPLKTAAVMCEFAKALDEGCLTKLGAGPCCLPPFPAVAAMGDCLSILPKLVHPKNWGSDAATDTRLSRATLDSRELNLYPGNECPEQWHCTSPIPFEVSTFKIWAVI